MVFRLVGGIVGALLFICLFEAVDPIIQRIPPGLSAADTQRGLAVAPFCIVAGFVIGFCAVSFILPLVQKNRH